MFKFVVALIVTSFRVTVYAEVTLRKSHVTNMQLADHYLDVPQHAEALPVVLILEEDRTLSIPDDISFVKAEGKKIVGGTQFFMTRTDNRMQMFFCPVLVQDPQNSQNTSTCLAPRVFQELQQLKCVPPELEATPHVIEYPDDTIRKCGNGGFLYRVYFPICLADPNWPYQYQYTTNSLAIYDFCYNKDTRKILFTTHYINSPKLLETFLLYQDRKLNYPYVKDDGYPIENYTNLYTHVESNSSVVAQHPKYVVQNFVPSEDMPFGIWKKTINQSFNIGLQQKDTVPVWNYINERVRDELIRQDWSNNDNLFLVKTSVFDNRVDIPTDGLSHSTQIYNWWVKMIISVQRQSEIAVSGVVLFMNNFINIGCKELDVVQLKILQDDLDEYCEKMVHCARNFRGVANKAKSQVKCCLVTAGLAQFFGVQTNDTLPLLHIPGLTTL